MSHPLAECPNDGCDITLCHDCGDDYTDPCAYHREHGHVASADPCDDGVDCSSCCRECANEVVAETADTAPHAAQRRRCNSSKKDRVL